MSSTEPAEHHRGVIASLSYLAATRLVINSTYRFVYPFLPAISRGLGISLSQAGWLVSIRSLAGVATPAIVATSGRGERRVRLVVASLSMFTIGAAVTAATGVFAGAVVGFALMGLGKPSFDAGATSYIADRVPYSRRARYLSVLELTWAGGLLIGAPAAGWLIARTDWKGPFWVVAALGLVAALAASRWMDSDDTSNPAPKTRLRPSKSTWGLLAAAFLFSFAAEVTFVVFGAWLEDSFMLSLVALGGASTLIGVAEMMGEGSVGAFADRVGKRRMVLIGLGASAIGYLLLGLVAGSLALGLTVMALTFVAFEITIVSTIPMASEVEPDARAKVLALLMVALSVARAVGSAVGPTLFEAGGFALNTSISAAAVVGAIAVIVASVKPE